MIQPYFGFDGERLLFDGWSDGGAAAHDITVSGEPGAITANFTRQVLLGTVSQGTIVVDPSGSDDAYHDLSSTVWLTAQPNPGLKFVSWLEDLSGSENPKSLLMDSRKWVRASFIDLQSFESDRIISSEPVEWLFGPGSDRSRGYNGYWVNVPTGATQLAIHLVTATQGTDVDWYANRGHRPSGPGRILGENNEEIAGYASQYLSTGPGGNESITITPQSSPPLEPGPYFIAINVRTAGVRVKGTLTAEVNVSEPRFAPSSMVTRAGSWSRNIEMRNRVPPGAALDSKCSSRTRTSGSSRSSSSGRSTASRARARARRSTTCTSSRATALALYPTPSATLTRPVSSETRLSDYSLRWRTRRAFGYRIV